MHPREEESTFHEGEIDFSCDNEEDLGNHGTDGRRICRDRELILKNQGISIYLISLSSCCFLILPTALGAGLLVQMPIVMVKKELTIKQWQTQRGRG